MEQNIQKSEIRKSIYKMLIPIILENIIQTSAGFVSMAIIGRVSIVAIGAIGLSSRITQMVWALFKGITTGSNVYISQFYGAGSRDKIKKVVGQTFISTMVLIFLIQIIIYCFGSNFLDLFHPSMELKDSSLDYLNIVTLGLPFMIIMLIVTSTYQGMGNAKTPFKIAIIVNIINIIFCFTTIYGFKMGIKGAALSLVISQISGALIGIYSLTNKNGLINLNKKFFNISLKDTLNIYKVGLPASFESLFWQIGALIVTTAILTFGETALAAYQLGLQVESINFMPSVAFAVVSTTFVGHSLGAGNGKKAKEYVDETVKGSFYLTLVGMILFVFFPKLLLRIFTNNVEVIDIGANYIRLMGFFSICQNLMGIFNGALRGAGYTNIPMFISIMGIWLIRVPFCLLCTFVFKMDIGIIWWIISLDMLAKCIVSYAIYKKKNIYEIESNLVEKM